MNLNSTADIVTVVEQVNNLASQYGNNGRGVLNPEVFYNKQLLDTIRLDADQYCYYRLADSMPIGDKADKLQLRRWSPLQAHTVPLIEGVPPKSDKGSVEKFEINAAQYGRYMEFTDKVDFTIVDPMIAIYTKEYSIVAIETLDMLAREALLANAQQNYAGGVKDASELTLESSKPKLEDLRRIVLTMKRNLIKPRNNGRFHVIGSPEFYYDMISDPIVDHYMTLNNTTKNMYDNGRLVPLFEMEFYETLACPTSEDFYFPSKENTTIIKRRLFYAPADAGAKDTDWSAIDSTVDVKTDDDGNKYAAVELTKLYKALEVGIKNNAAADAIKNGMLDNYPEWLKDQQELNEYGYYAKAFEGRDDKGSYIPGQEPVTIPAGWRPLRAHHILVLGKDALVRTGLSGQDQAKMYVKEKGSAGVLDPIDQRQSIGFKINSVGFGVIRPEAVHDYICIPTQVNY